MKFVIQRVNHASVEVDGKVIGSIQKGSFVVLSEYTIRIPKRLLTR